MHETSIKRLFDVAVAGAALTVSAPLIALLAAAIRVDSVGPIIFRQTRIGRGRRPIRALKLRTMVVSDHGPQITADRDPRITRVGRWLRKTKLDELPQLWNVLRGDMSLVGPRPEVQRYVDLYRPEWQPLLEVRPGLTDLASLVFRDEEALLALANDHERAYTDVIMPLKLSLALEGVARSSFRHDLYIIGMTAIAIVKGTTPMQAEILVEARRRIDRLNRGELL